MGGAQGLQAHGRAELTVKHLEVHHPALGGLPPLCAPEIPPRTVPMARRCFVLPASLLCLPPLLQLVPPHVQVADGVAKSNDDHGSLLWADKTLTRCQRAAFLLHTITCLACYTIFWRLWRAYIPP